MKRAASILGLMVVLAIPATAQAQGSQVCPVLDTGHQPGGGLTTITITAVDVGLPAGTLIGTVCVKAGSSQQGEGPEIITFDPPQLEVTFSHSSGKAISHFSVGIGTVTETPTPPPESPSPPTVGGGGGGGGGVQGGQAKQQPQAESEAAQPTAPAELAFTGPREAVLWLGLLATMFAAIGLVLLRLDAKRN
jgi:hypothetical protein